MELKKLGGFFVFAVICTLCVAQDSYEDLTEQSESASAGVILEFEQSENEDSKRMKPKKQNEQQPGGIDFIIGGQGEDGIAKRGELPVLD